MIVFTENHCTICTTRLPCRLCPR